MTDRHTKREITTNGRERSYWLFVPPSIVAERRAGLIIALHGGGSGPGALAAVTRLNRQAGTRGFVVVYPVGYQNFWHAGDDCCGPPYDENLDDVEFIRAMLDDVERHFQIDRSRVFALGFSNGGKMAYRLGCELSDRVAALAVGGSSLGLEKCLPDRPVPVIAFHGTADHFNPYGGGVGSATQLRIRQIGARETARRWAVINRCRKRARTFFKSGAVKAIRYGGCAEGAEVVLYTIKGMGHQWPGHTVELTEEQADELNLPKYLTRLGPGTSDIDATALSVDFFERHPMHGGV